MSSDRISCVFPVFGSRSHSRALVSSSQIRLCTLCAFGYIWRPPRTSSSTQTLCCFFTIPRVHSFSPVSQVQETGSVCVGDAPDDTVRERLSFRIHDALIRDIDACLRWGFLEKTCTRTGSISGWYCWIFLTSASTQHRYGYSVPSGDHSLANALLVTSLCSKLRFRVGIFSWSGVECQVGSRVGRDVISMLQYCGRPLKWNYRNWKNKRVFAQKQRKVGCRRTWVCQLLNSKGGAGIALFQQRNPGRSSVCSCTQATVHFPMKQSKSARFHRAEPLMRCHENVSIPERRFRALEQAPWRQGRRQHHCVGVRTNTSECGTELDSGCGPSAGCERQNQESQCGPARFKFTASVALISREQPCRWKSVNIHTSHIISHHDLCVTLPEDQIWPSPEPSGLGLEDMHWLLQSEQIQFAVRNLVFVSRKIKLRVKQERISAFCNVDAHLESDRPALGENFRCQRVALVIAVITAFSCQRVPFTRKIDVGFAPIWSSSLLQFVRHQ